MTIQIYYPKSGVLDIAELVDTVCKNPGANALELTGVNDFVGKLRKAQLGDALTAIRAVVAALRPLDELFKDEVLRKTNSSFETELSHIDISRSEAEMLDTKAIRTDMGKAWVKKYTKVVPKTTVTALTLERWQRLNEKRGKAVKKAARIRRKKKAA